VLIECNVSKGMFDTEYAVEIILPGGDKISLFADKELIKSVNGKTFLMVNVLTEVPENNEKSVLLPSESFEKGSRWVRFPADRLVLA